MSKTERVKLAAALRKEINDLRYRYHVLNEPDVTDAMYQGLMDKLRKLEEENPSLITEDSPTQRIAGKPLDKFEKVKHTVKQWSFQDAFNESDLIAWQDRIKRMLEKKLGKTPEDLDYIAELKIDGLHIVLNYRNGKLETAATRGDGKIGEDVTQNIKTIHSVPLVLNKKIDVIVEGEVWLSGKKLEQINKRREKEGLALYANPRNVAAGTIRQLDPKIVEKRGLNLTAYDISGGRIPETQQKELKELHELGFKTDKHSKLCKTTKEIVSFWDKWEKSKHSQEFWVDGVVVKVNQKKYQDALGFTGKAPRWAIALKFAAEQGTTKIKDIYVQVGRTGALTPVALMEPVQLAGTTVTHATLHNFDEIKRLGVRVGDTVVVEKAGDIIPKVVRVLEKLRTGKEKTVRMPAKCPICKSNVTRKVIQDKKKSQSAALFCENPKCYAQELEKIIHFVSKKAFNIDGLGEKIVEQLLEKGLIKNPADLFTLIKGDLQPLEGFAEKSADNIIKSINESKKISLNRFLFALGISQVGEETAIRLADHFKSLDKIISTTIDELENVEDVGPTVAGSINQYFSDKENKKYIQELKTNGVVIESQKQEVKTNKLTGKSFVFTGTLNKLSRDDAKELVRKNAGEVSGSVSKKTSFVVVGADPGSKYEKAKSLGVKIISEKEFLNLIKK